MCIYSKKCPCRTILAFLALLKKILRLPLWHGTKTVSTIGAGDNFNAGFIYGMIKYGVTRDDVEQGLSEEVWDKLIATATAFSADCCKDIFNYISKEFGQQLQNK